MKLCIKKMLDENNISKQKIADTLNVSRQYVYSLYNGTTKTIRVENVEKLCNIFNCTPNDLFINENNDCNNQEAQNLKCILANSNGSKLEKVKNSLTTHKPYQMTTLPDTNNLIDQLLNSGIMQAYIDDRISKILAENITPKKDDTK